MDKFFEPKISKETILFAVVFLIFITGVLVGQGLEANDSRNQISGVVGSGVAHY